MANTLRERQSSRQSKSTSNSSTLVQQSATTAAFHSPIHATVDGENVRLVAFGDLPGYSPAYLCVDKTGDSVWVPMEDTRIIDPNALPLQIEQAQTQRR